MRVAQASPAESRKAAILTPLSMIQQRQAPLSVLFVELNEAEQHFLRRFVAEGKLPACAEMCSTKALLGGDGDVISDIYRDRVARRGVKGSEAWGWGTAYGQPQKGGAPAAPAPAGGKS